MAFLKTSVILPCYNGEKFIAKCITSILNQTLKPNEIILIDDGSTDKSVEIARRYPIKIIKHPFNKGLAEARNTGIKNAKYDVIIFMDIDCIADANLIENIVNNYSSEKIAGVGGRGIEANSKGLANKYRSIHGVQWQGPNKKNVNGLFGLCFSFRRKILNEMGFFDCNFKTNGEDVDMGFRITGKGYKLIYDPEIKVIHLRFDATIKNYEKTVYNYFYYGSLAHLKNKNNSGKWFLKAAIRIFLKYFKNMISDIKAFRFDILWINVLLIKTELVSAVRVYKYYANTIRGTRV